MKSSYIRLGKKWRLRLSSQLEISVVRVNYYCGLIEFSSHPCITNKWDRIMHEQENWVNIKYAYFQHFIGLTNLHMLQISTMANILVIAEIVCRTLWNCLYEPLLHLLKTGLICKQYFWFEIFAELKTSDIIFCMG